MDIKHMNRADLECAILENDVLPCNTPADIARISAMTIEQLREAIGAWIAAGDETGAVRP